ncbi:hypothetical protein F183_A29020 [Bryobacterales bacterium F-183]|nr:hypothetical protein F183_A29020 [Bryobacterales bacterium F-183]
MADDVLAAITVEPPRTTVPIGDAALWVHCQETVPQRIGWDPSLSVAAFALLLAINIQQSNEMKVRKNVRPDGIGQNFSDTILELQLALTVFGALRATRVTQPLKQLTQFEVTSRG